MLDRETHTFETTAARDAWLGTHHPSRKATETPGFFELADGRRLGVHCETVTVYGPPCEVCGRATCPTCSACANCGGSA